MSGAKKCVRCDAMLAEGARSCENCGARIKRPWVLIATILVLAIAGVAAGVWKLTSRSSGRKAVPPETGPSRLANGSTIDYEASQDGRTLLLTVTTPSTMNPIFYFDVNRNGIIDPSDRGYVANSYGQLCEFSVAGDLEAPSCSYGASAATVSVHPAGGDFRTITLHIPITDIKSGNGFPLFVIGMFDVRGQKIAFYPGVPFTRAYSLKIDGFAAQPAPSASGAGVQGPGMEPRGILPSRPVNKLQPRPPPPSIGAFDVTPTSIQKTGNIVLHWSVKGSDSVSIEPGIGNCSPEDSITLPIAKSTTYTLTAKNAGGVVSRSVSVEVNLPGRPVIESFDAQPETVTNENGTKLSWSVSGPVTSIRIDPGLDSLPTHGERQVSVKAATTYRLVAQGPGGSSESDLRVGYAPSEPKITFNANPTRIRLGETSLLSWNISGASEVRLDPDVGAVAPTGSRIVQPLKSVVYVLHASGLGGSAQSSAAVIVAGIAGPSSGQLVWIGNVDGVREVTIDHDHADGGILEGALPGLPCSVQPENEKRVVVVNPPTPATDYEHLVLRVTGRGKVRVVVYWSVQQ